MKPLWKRKTFWVGIASILAGMIEGIFDGNWASAGEKVLIGFGLITGRAAISKIEEGAIR